MAFLAVSLSPSLAPLFPSSGFSTPASHFSYRSSHVWVSRLLPQQRRRAHSLGNELRASALAVVGVIVVDPWAPNIDSQSIASHLFAASLLPYLGFLYHLTKSKTAPRLTLFGFFFLLAFVGVTIPAGIYAKVHYGASLSNVDWLHGGAESFLTITNLCIVLGLRKALRDANNKSETNLDEEMTPLSK